MAWQNEIVTIIRVLINDLSSTPQYSDARLQQLAVVAAQYVQFDVNLDNKYTINIAYPSIIPDPTLDPKDDIFISLVSLKASCLVDQSTFRTKTALEGIRAALGPASLSVGGNLAGYKTLLAEGPCSMYEQLTLRWDVSNASAVRAIFSPFIGNNFDPQNLNNPNYNHSRYEDNQYY